jgi:hypothetical protein
MHRCRLAAAFAGVAAWCAARVIVTCVVALAFAIPFGLLLAFDFFLGDRDQLATAAIRVPPAPPRQPVSMPSPARLAA